MSLLRQKDLCLWDSMVLVDGLVDGLMEGEVEEVAEEKGDRIRPDLICNRVLRKGVCNRVKCRFSPCVFKDVKALEWHMVQKCWDR